ncbi:hypothetical protein HCN44_000094 [Aphidius gifuensis]|uniref:Uncharacterized protein n=1 Tax=Aphidius gifuensis TaxID=684658 RepID=A0A835CP72_APHGI|nr:hypothetical protein HCN44_000094 [Aphidius gifuensis]
MTDYISAELAATCDALGFYDGVKYHLDADALNVIKDLIKYLKRDDDTHTVRRYLGQTKLLENDLLQIAIHHTLMVYNEEIPKEKTNRNLYLQLVGYLQSYKTSLTDDRLWKVASSRLSKILEMEPGERGEENSLIIERILTLIRNILQVPPDDNEKRANTEATVHDEVLFALHTSRIVDLLLFISSNSSEQQYHMQILEIIALMLRQQNAMKLATTGIERTVAEKKREEEELLLIRRKEITEKIEKIKKYSGSRHSRFGGTFVVENMKAIGDNQMICHKPFQKVEALELARDKPKLKVAKNRRFVEARLEERISALSVRLFLKEFCVEFLNASYNAVMKYAKHCIVGSNQAASLDVSYFFWTLRFFMEFNRHHKFQVKYICETMGTEIFHLTQRQMEQYYELLITDKKKGIFWAKRLHIALKAYQELLLTLITMDKDIDAGVRESSKVIKSNIFYIPEYRETILTQFLSYDGVKMSRDYLEDLACTAHIFLKMLEQFNKAGRALIVRKTKQKRQNPKVIKSLEEKWDDIGPELSAVMQDAVIPDVIPFDATLDSPIEEQKSTAMKKIQKFLRKKEFDQAVGLLRSAREVWPENDCFGKADILVEEEFLALREIFLADLGVVEEVEADKTEEENVETFLNNENDERDDGDDEEDEENDDEPQYHETEFNYDEFLRRFVNVKIVKGMAILLSNFDNNSAELNHIIVKMLHRIAWDCKMPSMIFQATIFRSFQRIFESKKPEHKELKKFAVFIIRQFAEVAEKNQKAYMELLFWKNTSQAVEMVEGYDIQVENKKLKRTGWTETEEDELRTLFMEHQTNKHSQDVVDWILENMIREDRTRRSVVKKLKELYLITNTKKSTRIHLPEEWSEEEITQLTELWEIHRNDIDVVESISNGLTIKRKKNKIKEKLLELGLAKDKKELHKKRKKKSDGSQKASLETQSSSERSDSSDNSDSETSDTASKSNSLKIIKNNNKKSFKNNKQPAIVYSDGQLSVLIKQVIREEMNKVLEWLRESLQDALDDRDEESNDGISLVPLTDDSSFAMETPSFRKLLRAFGIEPPANEQEIHWRIPATMLPSTIRKRCELITNSLAGNFIEEVPEIRSDNDDNDNDDSDSSDDNHQSDLDNIKKLFNNNSNKKKFNSVESRQIAEGDDSSSDEDTLPTKTMMKKSVENKLTPKMKNSDNSQDNNKNEKLKLNKSRLKVMQDSSDSDSEMKIDNNDDENSIAETKRNRSDNSDNETPISKKRRVIQINSDDDTDDDKDNDADKNEEKNNETPEKNITKQSRRIISDDEDD